jgi:nucleoid-associated protein YgaU
VPDPAEPAATVTVEPMPRYVPVPAGDAPVAPPSEDEGGGYVPAPAGAAEVAPPPIAITPRRLFAGALDPGPNRSVAADAIGPELPPPAPATAADVPADRTVRPGDHLWGIAKAHLNQVLSRSPTSAELATYWAHLVHVNRAGLRSGDPDLIFPGEVVTCPPVRDAGIRR